MTRSYEAKHGLLRLHLASDLQLFEESYTFKRGKARTYFNAKQKVIAEAYFNHDNFPAPSEQVDLANQLNVDYDVVKTWFQNNRRNYRKSLKEESEYNNESPHHCEDCNVSFIASKDLAAHKLRHNNPGDGHTCSHCNVVFEHAAVYQSHLVSHAYPHTELANKKHPDDGNPRGLSGLEMALQQEKVGSDSDWDEDDFISMGKDQEHSFMSSQECILDNEADSSNEGIGDKTGDDDTGNRTMICNIFYFSVLDFLK
ncbi:unnamed protein product [Meganyctiphanes norvegica]|uniref:Homeobox domain-containing protein n=1 Tax=Meganyctiphanes norvegica TaxID=48144 RepID=A0AAV2S7Y8_MEGNR